MLASPKVPVQVALLQFTATQELTTNLWKLVLENQLSWSKDGWGGLLNKRQVLYVNPVLNASEAAVSINVSPLRWTSPLLIFPAGSCTIWKDDTRSDDSPH